VRTDTATTRTPVRRAFLLWLVHGSAALALLGFVLLTQRPPTYDEPWYLGTVELVHRHGLGLAFVRALPGPAGPLYPTIHWLLEPVTKLQVPAVRVVNCLLLAASVLGMARALRRLGAPSPGLSAMGLLGVPMIITTAGLALTEMPAVAFATWALALLFMGLDVPMGPKRFGLLGAAGLALGMSALGRQPLVVVLLCAPLLVIGDKRRRPGVALFMLSGACLPLALFAVWGGLVPSSTAYASGFSAVNGLMSCCYGLVVLWLLAAPLVSMPRRWAVAVAVAVAGANILVGFTEYLPLHTLVERTVPSFLITPLGRTLGGVFLAGGVLFLVAMGRRLWTMRHDGRQLFLAASALGLVLANAKVAHQFSSRYLAPAVPFLAMLDGGEEDPTLQRTVRLALGSGIGLLSLWSYLGA
jgi:4-amino-4-deoxy-L-arabinose transferase-like glycosyltransferase